MPAPGGRLRCDVTDVPRGGSETNGLGVEQRPCIGATSAAVDDLILQVGNAGRFDRPDVLELEVGAEAFEEPRSAAEYQRDDVQLDLLTSSAARY